MSQQTLMTLKSSVSWVKIIELCLYAALLACCIYYLSCRSADENLTSKNLDCSKLTEDNSLTCCLQFMSSNTGNDSKDAFCSAIKDELAESFREERKKNVYLYCKKEPDEKSFQSCWDKLHTK